MGNTSTNSRKSLQNSAQPQQEVGARKYSLTHRASRYPKRLILIRHGESMGNADESQYCTTPDWQIPLTERGKAQARAAGAKIKEIIGDEPVTVYCSPYLRTKQTLQELMTQLDTNPLISAREEPRLTEQQFGNFQTTEAMKQYKKERSQFGRFYYRFPQGESGLDVYNRVSLFIGTLFREWEKDRPWSISDGNMLIVTHGLTLRLFLMRWYHFSVNEFENSVNPDNATIVTMTRKEEEARIEGEEVSKSDFIALHRDEDNHARYDIDEATWTAMNLKSSIQRRRSMLRQLLGRESIDPDDDVIVELKGSSRDAIQQMKRARDVASLDLAIMMSGVPK